MRNKDNLTATSIEPRWGYLRSRIWKCSSCGEMHDGIIDLACSKPDFWQGPEEQQPNSAVATPANLLTEDFCILDSQHYFVRCVLKLPLIGTRGEHFAFGVWSTLSKKNFDKYVATFDSGTDEDRGPWFGWLSNRLKPYPDTLNLKCQVHTQTNRQRPSIELEQSDHPLWNDATSGITYERLIQIYAAHGHAPG